VKQSTSEDWKNVSLSLSTSNPSFHVQPPELKTISLGFGYTKQAIGSIPTGTGTGSSLSMIYSIPSKQSIPSDGINHKLLIGVISLTPSFSYFCTPKVSDKVYTLMKTINESEYALLPGELSIFHFHDFIAKSKLKITNPKESMEVFIGVDPDIKVTYGSKKYKETNMGLFSGRIKMNVERKIKISNKKMKSVKMVVMEPFPLSNNSQITVELVEPSKFNMTEKQMKNVKVSGVMVDEILLNQDHHMEWRFQLDKDIQIPLKYNVSWPSGKDILDY
jgi:uncharacterized protein (TIGR02231 family)